MTMGRMDIVDLLFDEEKLKRQIHDVCFSIHCYFGFEAGNTNSSVWTVLRYTDRLQQKQRQQRMRTMSPLILMVRYWLADSPPDCSTS